MLGGSQEARGAKQFDSLEESFTVAAGMGGVNVDGEFKRVGLNTRHWYHILGATHSLPGAARDPVDIHLVSLGQALVQHSRPSWEQERERKLMGRGSSPKGVLQGELQRPSSTGCHSRTGRAHYPPTGPPSRPATSQWYRSSLPRRPSTSIKHQAPSPSDCGGGAQVWTLSRSPSMSSPGALAALSDANVQEQCLESGLLVGGAEAAQGDGKREGETEGETEGVRQALAGRGGGTEAAGDGEGGPEGARRGDVKGSGEGEGSSAERGGGGSGGGGGGGGRGGGSDGGGSAERHACTYVSPVKLQGDPGVVAHKAFAPQPVARVRRTRTGSWVEA